MMGGHNTDALTMRDMLVIEDDSTVLDFSCAGTGLPLWPQIRVAFFRMLMSDSLYEVGPTGRSNARVSPWRAMGTLLRSMIRNTAQRWGDREQARILFTCDGVSDQLLDGRWFNRLVDYFVAVRPDDSLTFSDQFEWRWPFPRHHDRVLLHAPWQAANAVRGRVGVRASHRRQASELVQLVCERAHRNLNWSVDAQRRTQLIAMLAYKSASMPWQFDAYRKLLGRVRPAVLMVGAGCYGPAASLIAAAKSLGVITAEYQHGAVTAGHDAYNFAPTIRDSELYRRTLPDHFLGYGTWWNRQINAPVRKWAIGNPFRAAKLAAAPKHEGVERRDLLVLSDGIELEMYLDLARGLHHAAASRGFRVVLRPHPLERTRALALTRAAKGGIDIDTNADLYASLRMAHAVVSEVSTGLFEAIGIADRIFMWDTPKARFGYPTHPFHTFGSIADLIGLLADENAGRLPPAFEVEAIWATGWRDHYLQFLREQGAA